MNNELGSRIGEIEFGKMVRKGDSAHYEYFKKGRSYIVPSGVRHQIISGSSGRDIGIGFSKNGAKGFRCFDTPIVYWFGDPKTYVLSAAKEDSIDLTEILKGSSFKNTLII
jgi:hypothetical protein